VRLGSAQLVDVTGSPASQVPNSVFVNNPVTNLSKSANTTIYQLFQADAATVTKDSLKDLSSRLHAAAIEHPEFFDATYEAWAHIHSFENPLKYQVCITSAACTRLVASSTCRTYDFFHRSKC
jgi:hypothetical protein